MSRCSRNKLGISFGGHPRVRTTLRAASRTRASGLIPCPPSRSPLGSRRRACRRAGRRSSSLAVSSDAPLASRPPPALSSRRFVRRRRAGSSPRARASASDPRSPPRALGKAAPGVPRHPRCRRERLRGDPRRGCRARRPLRYTRSYRSPESPAGAGDPNPQTRPRRPHPSPPRRSRGACLPSASCAPRRPTRRTSSRG